MRILLIADLHIGSIKDTQYFYHVVTDILEKEAGYKKCDMIVILGDYFDRLFKANEEYISLAVNIMSLIIRLSKRNNTKIRIIYGTESHEMNQYKLFNYHLTSKNVDMKVFDTATEECIDGKNILYLPEEYIDDKHEFYKDYLYSNKKYDYIFGHGIIEDGMPSIISYSSNNKSNNEKQVPRFKSQELINASILTVFGHYHTYTNIDDKVYYVGSLFRSCFGEEDPKGYGIIEDDKFIFVENTEAYIYKTYEYNPQSEIYLSQENIINEINRIKDENVDLFSGNKVGKIKLVFKTPDNLDPSFKENLTSVLFNEKLFTTSIKETSYEVIDNGLEDDSDTTYNFILDPSVPIVEKYYQYLAIEYDTPMSKSKLEKYIKKAMI
jgi:DNA repair exonuclease SbcCD nuclease subunit